MTDKSTEKNPSMEIELKVGKHITANALMHVGDPFFARWTKVYDTVGHSCNYTCLCAVTSIEYNYDSDYPESSKVIYTFGIVHTYKDKEFGPGLTAKDEFAKYNNINRKHATEFANKMLKYAQNDLETAQRECSDSREAFGERLDWISSAGWHRPYTDIQKDLEWDIRKKENKRNLEIAKKDLKKREKELDETFTKEIVWEGWVPTDLTMVHTIFDERESNYYQEYQKSLFTNELIREGNTIFLTSNAFIKCQLGLPYKKAEFEEYQLCKSKMLEHSVGEPIINSGATHMNSIDGVQYHFVTGFCVKNKDKLTYYSHRGIRELNGIHTYTDDDFEYSNNVMKALAND